MEALAPELLLIALLVGAGAGLFDTVVGGGGLITLPALLAFGLGPAEALATNKLQGSLGTLAATLQFRRLGLLDLAILGPAALCAFLGSLLGALLVSVLSATTLERIIPLLLLLFAAYFLFSPRIAEEDSQARLGPLPFAVTAALGIGFYDGFFGPGTGSFFSVAIIMLLGFNLRRAIGNTKLLNFASNLGALLVFTLTGHIQWLLGLTLGVGQMAGAWLGSHAVVKADLRLLKPLLVVVALAISIKLLLH